MPSPARSGAILPILPDPTTHDTVSAETSATPDFSIAPSVDNILNRRHDLSEDPTGMDGSSDSYVRTVRRTFGFALRKRLY